MVENALGILVSRSWILLGTVEQRPKVVKDIVFYICGVAQHAEDTPGTDRVPTPANDVAAIEIAQVVYMPNDYYRNPLREAKHQQKLLKEYFNHVGALTGQKDRI